MQEASLTLFLVIIAKKQVNAIRPKIWDTPPEFQSRLQTWYIVTGGAPPENSTVSLLRVIAVNSIRPRRGRRTIPFLTLSNNIVTLSRDGTVMRKSLWLALVVALALASLGASDVTLPKNLWIADGTQYEDFESAAEWLSSGGSVSNDTLLHSGTRSVMLTAYSDTTAAMIKTVNWDLSSSALQQIQFWVYQHDAAADYGGSLILSLSNDANFLNYYRVWLIPERMGTVGWHQLVWAKSSFKVGAGAPSWASPIERIRLEMIGAVGKSPSFSFDDLRVGARSRPAVVLSFDDGYSAQYASVFPTMRQHGIRGTLNPVIDWGLISGDQLREMAAAGWTIGNHTRSHQSMIDMTEAEQEQDLTDGLNDLTGQGLAAGARYVAYPYGESNDDTMTAMADLGMLTGRTVEIADAIDTTPYPAWVLPPDVEPYDHYHLPARPCGSGDSLASLEGAVDDAIRGGTILPLLFHYVGGYGEISTADFKALIGYIAARRDSIDALTMDDIYQLTLGPVTVPKMAAGTVIETSVVPSATLAGEPVTYTLAFNNGGIGPARDVVISDPVPVELMNVGWVSSGAAITPTGVTNYTWEVADLEVGAGGVITLTGVISPNLASGVFTNTATLQGRTDGSSSSVPLTVLGPPVISVGKTVTPTSRVAMGATVTYTVALTNTGESPAAGLRLTDTLPVSTTFGGWIDQPGGSGVADGQITWRGDVAPGRLLTWTFVATHTGAYGDVVANTARFGYTTGSGHAEADFTVLGPPVISVGKTVTPTSRIAMGGTVTYTVALTNTGESPAAGLRLTDTLPVSTTFGGWIDQPGGSGVADGQITWRGDVAPGQHLTWIFVATHTGSYGDVVANTARSGYTTGSGHAEADFTVLGPPVISIGKKVTPTSRIAIGETVTYTLELTNTGESPASGLRLTDTLPVSTTFAGWLHEPGGSSVIDDQITWRGDVAPGQLLTWTFVATHTGAYGDVVANTARFGCAAGSGHAEADFTVLGPPVISIGKTVTPTSGLAVGGRSRTPWR